LYIKKIGGGNGHGMVHYKETNHSLVVKLGTITSSGASVHCYSCDDEVIDHNLRDHLANFGIDIEK
jgi:ubiquitin carboxyl-terminal hydrolase 5/13